MKKVEYNGLTYWLHAGKCKWICENGAKVYDLNLINLLFSKIQGYKMSIVNALKKLEEKGFTLSEAISFIEKSGIAWSVTVSSDLFYKYLKETK